MTGPEQRKKLQSQIWQIANNVRGAVDGWDFKQYVLGTLFYRFMSENFSSYIQADDDSINYAELSDAVITPEIKDDAIKTKGYFIYPSQLFANIAKTANKNESLNKATLVEDVRRIIRSSIGNRAKESLLVDFINQTDLDKIGDKASVIDAFFAFAQVEQKREVEELISSENLDEDAARRYIATSIRREFATDNGTELNSILPKMSPLNPQYLTKKQSVLKRIAAFVEKFKGVGGEI